jgi:hypothetical protein
MGAGDSFDFDFGAQSRAELLTQVGKSVAGLASDLGGGVPKKGKAHEAARQLLADLGTEIAQFSTFPEIVPLKAEHFELHGVKAPARFTDLSQNHRFYWIRFPLTLRPADNKPFVKLQCAVEFNPGKDPGHLRPVAQMILPDKRFQTLLQGNASLTLGIGEDFEFKASGAQDIAVPVANVAAAAKGSVDVKVAGAAGMAVGPFTYTLKKARINHSGSGTERVFWTLDGAEFFEEQEPVLVVVLRVPNEVKEVQVAAALQASHEFKILAAPIGALLEYLGKRISEFFRAGAPAAHTQVWDLTPRL